MKNSKSKYYYSPVQYFFWLFSGCEINILKNCPTDFNRQAGIGFTIFMTTLFAFAAGSYSGYYFTKDYFSAFGFGLIWALLVFSIDRAMVVTMKKDPTLKAQPFWIPLISRGFLALLIAFVISIPLELLIFRDQIEIQKKKDEIDTIIEIKQGWIGVGNVKEDKASKVEAENEAKIAEENANNCNSDKEYKRLDSELQVLQSIMSRFPRYINYTVNNTPKTRLNPKYITARNNYNSKLRQRNNRCVNYKNEQTVIANNKKNEAIKLKDKIDKNTDIADKKADTMQKLLKNSFIRDFISLENAAYSKKISYDTIYSTKTDSITKQLNRNIERVNKTIEYENSSIIFFLWLIRILFFLIELLPTISKIVTPVGAYDMAIYRREKDFEKELEDGSEKYLEQQKYLRELEDKAEVEIKKEVLELEKKMKLEIMKEASDAQNKVAKKKIDDFKTKHL
jgi:hypothetical protein